LERALRHDGRQRELQGKEQEAHALGPLGRDCSGGRIVTMGVEDGDASH
jgi:hypothetical protein